MSSFGNISSDLLVLPIMNQNWDQSSFATKDMKRSAKIFVSPIAEDINFNAPYGSHLNSNELMLSFIFMETAVIGWKGIYGLK